MYFPWDCNSSKYMLCTSFTSFVQETQPTPLSNSVETLPRTFLFLVGKSEELSYDCCDNTCYIRWWVPMYITMLIVLYIILMCELLQLKVMYIHKYAQ